MNQGFFVLASEQSGVWSWLEHISVSYHVLELIWTIGVILLGLRFVVFDLRDRLRRNNYSQIEFSLVTLSNCAINGTDLPRYEMRIRPALLISVVDALGGDHRLAKKYAGASRRAGPGRLLRFTDKALAGDVASLLRTRIDLTCSANRMPSASEGVPCAENSFVFFAASEQSLREPGAKSEKREAGAERLRVIVLSRDDYYTLVRLCRANAKLTERLVRDADDVSHAAIVRRAQTLQAICAAVNGFAETPEHAPKEGLCGGTVKIAA